MINIKVVKNKQNIVSIEITGHSGYAVSGQDIVCAAVSSIAQTLILGLKRVLKVKVDAQVDEDAPYLFVNVAGLLDAQMQQAQILMQTALIGLKEVQTGYTKYIKIKESSND